MDSNTAPTSGNYAQRSSMNKSRGNGSMLSQLENQSHHGTPVKMSDQHDRIADSRISSEDFGGLRPKDHSDSGAGSKQRDSGFIDFTPTPDHSKIYYGLNPLFFKKQSGHEDRSSAFTDNAQAYDNHDDQHGNHTGFSITGLSTLSHKDRSSHISTLMPRSGPDHSGDQVSSQSVNLPSHPSEQDRDGLLDSTHPSAFPSTKHKKSKGGDQPHEPEIDIGELPKHERFNGPLEYLEDDRSISQHAPQHSQGTSSSVAHGVGTGLVSLGAAAAAASHHISNPPAVNYAGQKTYDAPMTHHDGSSAERAAVPQKSFFTQPATYHDVPSHDTGGIAGYHPPTSHSGVSEPHPSSNLATHSVTASSMLDAHEKTSRSSSHGSSRPVYHAPVHFETIHEAYHGPTTQSAPISGQPQKPMRIETIHEPYHGDYMPVTSTDTKESELGRAGSQQPSASTSTDSSVPLSTGPQKKKWLGFEINRKEKKPKGPPGPLALGFGFKETRKAAIAAAKARQVPPKGESISAPTSAPSAASSAPEAISAQGVHSSSIAGPSSSAFVSNPTIVSVKPTHHVGRTSPAPHSFSPSQDRPVHPDISYHSKKKSKKPEGKSLFPTPTVPAGMSRSPVPPKAQVKAPAPMSARDSVVASSSTMAPMSSSDALSAHVSGFTSIPVHSQHQHHANSPVTPEMLAAAVAAGTAAHTILPHEHSTAATLKKPKVNLSLYPEEEETYPRGEESHQENPAHPEHPVVVQEVQKSIPKGVSAAQMTLPHEHSSAATLKKPKVNLSLFPEEEETYPRGEESHQENPAHPEHPVVVQEVQKSIPKGVSAAQMTLPHEHSSAATLKKPKVDLSLYPEEEETYPRGEESRQENPSHPEHPVVVQEVQLDAEDQYAHHDLHCSKTPIVAAAMGVGMGGAMSDLNHTRGDCDTPKAIVAETTSTTSPSVVESAEAPAIAAVPATTRTTDEKGTEHADATPEKSNSDLALARAAAASALASASTLDNSKSNCATSDHTHLEEGSSISARREESVVDKSAPSVLVTDKATSTDPSVGVSSHQSTSNVPVPGSHPVRTEVGTSTHPVGGSMTAPTESTTDAAVPLVIAAGTMTAPLAALALNKHQGVDDKKATITSAFVHDGKATGSKHIDKSTISKPISATPLVEDISKEKVRHIVKEADPSSVTKISVAAAPSSIASVIPHKNDEEVIMLKTTTTSTVPKKDRKAPKKDKMTHLDKPADDITSISMFPATAEVTAIIPHEADEEVLMMKTTTIQHIPKSSIAVAAGKVKAKINKKIHRKSVDKTAIVTEKDISSDSKTPIASASASKTGSGVPVATAAVAALPIAALAASHHMEDEHDPPHDNVETHEVVGEAHVVKPHEETHTKTAATTGASGSGSTNEDPVVTENTTAVTNVADSDNVEPVAVETEKQRKKREKKELKKEKKELKAKEEAEKKELKAKEKAEKKALKEKQRKPPVDISGKLSSIAAPAVAAIAAASASPSNPHNQNTEPIKLKGQNFLLAESDVLHPAVVPVSQTLLLNEDDIVHPSVPVVSQSLALNEDDVEHPTVPIVSQRLTMNEDDVEKPVLAQPAAPVLRVHEHHVRKPEITQGHLVIPYVAPKAVSTSALKVANAARPMIPPRPVEVKKEKVKKEKVKKEKVKTGKKMKLPVVRMPRFRKKAKKPVEGPKALATVPVVENVHVIETHVVEPLNPVAEVSNALVPVVATAAIADKVLKPPESVVVQGVQPHHEEVLKPAAVSNVAAAAAVPLPPSPKPVVVQGVQTHHREVPKPAAVAAVTAAAAVALPPSPKPAPVMVDTKAVEPPKPVAAEQVKSDSVEPPKPVPVVAPIAVAPVVAAPVIATVAPSTMKTTTTTGKQEYSPAVQKEEITAMPSAPVVTAPEGYSGPIPSLGSGETVVWVKKIRTSQEYYHPEDEDDLDEFGYRKDRDPSRYLAPQMPRGMSNADQRVNYHIRNHTRPGSAEAFAQRMSAPAPAQNQKQGIVGNTGGYNTQPRQSAF